MRNPSSTLGSELGLWEIRATSRSFLGSRLGSGGVEFAQWRTPPLAPKLVNSQGLSTLGTALCARASHVYVHLSRPPSRSCKVSYGSTAAAALTPSDWTLPRSGSATSSSHSPATRGRSPAPSLPSTSTTPAPA